MENMSCEYIAGWPTSVMLVRQFCDKNRDDITMLSHALKHQTAVVSRSWEGEINLLDEMKNIYPKKPIMIQKNSSSDQPSVK